MKRVILGVAAILMIVLGSAMLVNGQEIGIETTMDSNEVHVVEKITADDETIDSYDLWNLISDNVIVINDISITLPSGYNFSYKINFTQNDIPAADYYEIEYNLDESVSLYKLALAYNTSSVLITFDGTEIFSGTNLESGSMITVALQKQTQGETETVENIPVWVYAIIVVLLILLIVSLMRSNKGQKSVTKKESASGSKEFFTTKKSLLMETLKEIEKLHRSKKISDETYHKLKDRYKQEAVDAMRKLEDMNK